MINSFSDKIICISENKELVSAMNTVLKKHNLSIATSYLNLHSPTIIRNQVKNLNSTAFIQKELKRFIAEKGYPFITILDARINSGLGKDKDPDGMRIFRTFLLSFLIIAKGKHFESFKGNILLLSNGEDIEYMKELTHNPKGMLNQLKSGDSKINEIIDNFRDNIYGFSTRFYVECINSDLAVKDVLSGIDKYLVEIENRKNLKQKQTEGAAIDNSDYKAAELIFKTGANRVYIDGYIAENNSEYEKIEEGQIYVRGYWTNRTQLEVAKKIAHFVLRGIDGTSFEPENKISINLLGDCKIDAATVASLAVLMSKELKDYPHIIIYVNKENGLIFRNSKGFGLIQKNVRYKN